MEQDPILRPRAAAALLGIGITTLYRWAHAGQISPPIKLGPRASGWRHSYLDAFIKAREQRAPASALGAGRAGVGEQRDGG